MSNSIQPNGTGGRTGARSGNNMSGPGSFQSSNEQWGLADTHGVTYNKAAGAKSGQNPSSAVPNVGPSGKSSSFGGTQPNGTGGRTGGKSGPTRFGGSM